MAFTVVANVSTNFSITVAGGFIKHWNGTAWVKKPVKFWNGTAWVTKPVKVWNGTAWVKTK